MAASEGIIGNYFYCKEVKDCIDTNNNHGQPISHSGQFYEVKNTGSIENYIAGDVSLYDIYRYESPETAVYEFGDNPDYNNRMVFLSMTETNKGTSWIYAAVFKAETNNYYYLTYHLPRSYLNFDSTITPEELLDELIQDGTLHDIRRFKKANFHSAL